jgi:hypothetical protein
VSRLTALTVVTLLLSAACANERRADPSESPSAASAADAGTMGGRAPDAKRPSLFIGDYQTGTFDQWPGKNLPPGAAQVGKRIAPVPPPRLYPRVARFTIGLGGPRDRRTEVLRHPASNDGVEGVDTWWRWYILFPKNGFTEPPNGDLILSDWHNTVAGCAPLAIFDALRGGPLVLRIRAGATRIRRWGNVAAPPLNPGFEGRTYNGGHEACETQVDRRYAVIPRIRRNHWYSIVIHVKWTSRTRGGFFDVWVDGCRRTPGPRSPRRRIATLMDPKWGQGFFKQGIYDPHGWPPGTPTSTVFYTGTRQYHTGARILPRRCDPRALRRGH